MKAKIAIAFVINACIAMPVIAADIYRWTDPETGKIVTTPSLPPYPIKEKRTAGGLPNSELINVIIDTDTPQVKLIIEKRKAKEQEEKRIEAEREKQKKEAEERRANTASKYSDDVVDDAFGGHSSKERYKRCGMDAKIGMTKEDFMEYCKIRDTFKETRRTVTAQGEMEVLVYKNPGGGPYDTEQYYFMNDRLMMIQK